MTEIVVEGMLSMMDYTILLYFYHKLLRSHLHLKKAILSVICISLLQFIKDSFFNMDGVSLFLDDIIICLFLFLYSKRVDLYHLLCACTIESIFSAAILLYMAIAKEFSIDIEGTLMFGISRITYALLMKVFVIGIFLLSLKVLQEIEFVFDYTFEKAILGIMFLIMMSFSYIFGNIFLDDSILWDSLLFVIILIFMIYIMYRYGRLLKQLHENNVIVYKMNTTSAYVMKLEREHEKIRMIRHDMKNQLSALGSLMETKRYHEASSTLQELLTSLDLDKVSLSNNIYVDAILRQKMNENPLVEFDIDITLSKDFTMDSTDIISLLSNIIDNACEELHRIDKHDFTLKIKGNATQLVIEECNRCRKQHSFTTSKDCKTHGLGMKIMNEIVNKYHGKMQAEVHAEVFTLKIILPFHHSL